MAETLGHAPGVISADAAYGTGKVYAALAERDVEACFAADESDAHGARANARFAFDTVGAWKEPQEQPKPCTGWPEPFGAASPTSASRRS